MLQTVFCLALGAAVGSFLTVVAARLPALVLEDRGFALTARKALQAVSWPGSRCDACGCGLALRDNIPILSYAMLKGHCRDCHAQFPPTWVLELSTAAAAAFCAVRYGWTGEAVILFLFLALLLVLSAIDLAEQLLPDVLVVPLALLGLVHAQTQGDLMAALAASALAGSLLWGLAIAFRAYAGQDGMGLGDVKLAAALGLWLLPEILPFFLVAAFAAGLLWQLPALFLRKADARTAVPFGPFLSFSAALFVFFPQAGLWLQQWIAGY
jgi:leader peptidase (prepilin peptidase)/N-methyltransferase